MADTDPKKREKLVDELLGRKEFVEMWVMKFAELLQIRSDRPEQVSYKAALLYYNWLQDQIAEQRADEQDRPGAAGARPAARSRTRPRTTTRSKRDTLKIAENTAQVFMGMRIQCAQCHNHPFDRWTQNDYYGFAAFFAQVGRKQGEDPRETIVFNTRRRRGEPPGHRAGDAAQVPRRRRSPTSGQGPPRGARQVARLARRTRTSPRTWPTSSGPTSSARGSSTRWTTSASATPPSTPSCSKTLGEKFTEYNYDFKRLVRDICTSPHLSARDADQRDQRAGRQRNFSHAAIRRIRAEVLLDCISQVTETKEKFRGLPLGGRAVQIADGEHEQLLPDHLRPGHPRDRLLLRSEDGAEPLPGPAPAQRRHRPRPSSSEGGVVIKCSMTNKKTPEQIIEDLYLRCFNRKPTRRREHWPAHPRSTIEKGRRPGLLRQFLRTTAFWALCSNSQEFIVLGGAPKHVVPMRLARDLGPARRSRRPESLRAKPSRTVEPRSGQPRAIHSPRFPSRNHASIECPSAPLPSCLRASSLRRRAAPAHERSPTRTTSSPSSATTA